MNTPDHIDPKDTYIDGALWQFQTARYTVALFAEEEDIDPADSFCDERDIEFARSGDPAHWFMAVVAVYGPDGDRIGWDTLGGCSYHSFQEFYSAHRWRYNLRRREWVKDPRLPAWKRLNRRDRERSRNTGTYFTGMVRQAIADARTTLGMQRDGEVRVA